VIKLGDHELLRVYAKHDPYWDTGHLVAVTAQMVEMGPPTIAVVEWRGSYFATEGSHRLCAAHHLGYVPNLEISEPYRVDPTDEGFWETAKGSLPHYTWEI
jgi:hypothetical protein